MLLNIDAKVSTAEAVRDALGGVLTYGELTDFVSTIKSLLPERVLLFLLVENDCGGVAWSIGSMASGRVPLILNAHLDEELYQSLFDRYRPPYVCVPSRLANRYAYKIVGEYYNYTLLSTGEVSCLMHQELSHLLPTSGTTGSPKLVRHKYENIEAAALNISSFFELKSTDRPFLVLPLYYTMGLSVVFSHLFVGCTIILTNYSMTDRRFWQQMKEEKATSFTGVPYSFEVMNLMRIFRMELPDIELLTQGGGRMSKELNVRFAEWCQKTGRRWIATYGQSECTARMAYLPSKWALEKVGSIGVAVPNAELWLEDECGNRIEEANVEGEMCYRGRNVTMGYARQREDLLLGDENHGMIHTGDIARRDSDGCYYITGRKGRFLKLFGLRVGLDDCEQLVRGKFNIDCACVGNDEKMTVFITRGDMLTEVQEELVNRLKLVATSFEVKTIDFLPRNEVGKILYSKLKIEK